MNIQTSAHSSGSIFSNSNSTSLEIHVRTGSDAFLYPCFLPCARRNSLCCFVITYHAKKEFYYTLAKKNTLSTDLYQTLTRGVALKNLFTDGIFPINAYKTIF